MHQGNRCGKTGNIMANSDIAVDFKSKENRKKVHQVWRAIFATNGTLTYDAVYEKAFGHTHGIGQDDVENFRKGKLAQDKVESIHRWMMANYLRLGSEIAPEIFKPSLLNGWHRLLWDHLIYDDLEACLYDRSLGLTQRSKHQPIADLQIELGQEYYFTLDAGVSGKLLAFEGYEGQWYPFSLHHDGVSLTTQIIKGKDILPTKPDGVSIDPLSDTEHKGLHRFVFIIAPQDALKQTLKALSTDHPASPSTLDDLAETFKKSGTPFELHGLNVIFVSA